MQILRTSVKLAAGIGLLLGVAIEAQQLTPGQSADPSISGARGLQIQSQQPVTVKSDSNTYHEVDLLRRDGFSVAEQAMVSIRVFDKKGVIPLGLTDMDFMLMVNGSPRDGKVQAPGAVEVQAPMVLVVFPPNQPIVHSIGVTQLRKYFSSLPNEVLPWRVGILDANGKATAFTNGKTQLLAYLDVVDHAKEPFEYWTDVGLRASTKWDGGWLTNAEQAIALMQSFTGPKVILAINPIADAMYGLNDQILSHEGPESLVQIAQHVGAHIYIANVGGPDVEVPGGDAAQDRPGQVNVLGGAPLMGTTPSSHMQVDPSFLANLDYFALRSSVMMVTAKETLGGFSNSMKDLAGYIHRDLDQNYSLTFEMTARDRDIGIPNVEVRMVDHAHKVAILDVTPVGSTLVTDRMAMTKEVQDRVKKESKHPVSSPDFALTQRVDFFPLRSGLRPILPMTAKIEWKGQGRSPRRLAVAETVEETNLSSMILDRDVQLNWNGRSLTWERDGVLNPGHYLWRVALHDEQGKVYASVERKIEINFPRGAPITTSSLVVGKSCGKSMRAGGGLQKRDDSAPSDENHQAMPIDPMLAADCRVRPEATDQFEATDALHALVRIYPTEKLAKRTPGDWTARFVLRSAGGAVETEKEIPFTFDSESGFLAYVEVPLNAESIRPGEHTLNVAMRGPGIHGDLKESQPILISGTAQP